MAKTARNGPSSFVSIQSSHGVNSLTERPSFDAQTKAREDIKKLMPRKPARLNDVSERFAEVKRRHAQLNSAMEDLTVKQPATSLTKGAINLNDDDYELPDLVKQSAIDAAVQLETGYKRKPVKFVSQINNKPIDPPYIELTDFESYVKHQSQLQTEQLTGVRSDKQPDAKPQAEEQNYTYKDLKEKFEVMMDVAVFQKQKQLEERREQEKLERMVLMKKLSRGIKRTMTIETSPEMQ